MADQVLWFRRDLRLSDHPALSAAAGQGDRVAGLFVLDPALWEPSGPVRQAWLLRSLAALSGSMDGNLVIRCGAPSSVVPRFARDVGADAVHITADAGPYGRRRDQAVAEALDGEGRALVATGTPYAIGPGTLLNGSGTPYKVFTPFSRAWLDHGWPKPAGPVTVHWRRGLDGCDPPSEPDLGDMTLPPAGEAAAAARWHEFLNDDLAAYADQRNDPAANATSRMSVHLKFGEIHPRTMLADLAHQRRHRGEGAAAFRAELCWREFYADVLWHQPDSARQYLRGEYAKMRYAQPGASFQAWCAGQTGFPMVDAGMRQLLSEGWMHNRARMIVASFLVKDLHVEWQHGARFFMRWLRDGDLASNQHGWQWVAGSGTDAAPYFRVFNPVTQGTKFDPSGDYVRRYVPELRHLDGIAAHEPWKHPDGYVHGYPEPIVDHQVERQEALARYAEIRR
jgi:deoxyribodipyrimidine photo-lyase